ncbi:MAG: regulatory iron-sulfur-containing complex subunit RicT [Isosphaeraceae bacterium]|nr:regulatory iron-sulfur-containing complex subunit RicT [Isosphaeraceae bacterium]
MIRTDRGTELGVVLCLSGDRSAAFLENPVQGEILRLARPTDLQAANEQAARVTEAMMVCRDFAGRRRLQMELVDVEFILGGERVVVYYLAERRVDFRELVKDLARQFQTRIEMRQIGVRDEAKLLADYGDCGKPVCCNTHLTKMPPVSMRMAKLQKTTLDPSKISGRCGRLKCCLRYEFDTYQAIERELPPTGAKISTTRGVGKVLAHEILSKRIVVELEDRRRVVIGLDEISDIEYSRPRGVVRDDPDDLIEQ